MENTLIIRDCCCLVGFKYLNCLFLFFSTELAPPIHQYQAGLSRSSLDVAQGAKQSVLGVPPRCPAGPGGRLLVVLLSNLSNW